MGLISLPPETPRADLDLEGLLRHESVQDGIFSHKRTLVAEWYPQSGVQLTWPHEQTDWAPILGETTTTYIRLAYEIATRERLIIVTPEPDTLWDFLKSQLPHRAIANIRLVSAETNDTWARDHAFLSVVSEHTVELHDYKFNGWGDKFEAEKDNAINRALFDSGLAHGTYVNHLNFVLEGGSIETDGQGTLLTTSRCLLNPNRNPSLSRETIEASLKDWLGVEHILWLDYGHLEGDDTDAHIDTLARLCPDGKLLFVRCDNPAEECYEEFQQMEAQLRSFTNAQGQPYELIPLPWPEAVVADGERLPATYANYLVLNRAVLLPTYNQPEKDAIAIKALSRAFPGYDIVPVPCTTLLKQHGSLHCATMQYPKGVFNFTNE
ncbi:MAG: agmatine deiminase family protein [Alloprevotella sp.]|nr:agmatine deiminase family protein [Alloprevotella sp.]